MYSQRFGQRNRPYKPANNGENRSKSWRRYRSNKQARNLAVAWQACNEDQNRDFIRVDGFTRKNAGAAIDEYVVVRPAKVKTALSITLAPVDMRLNVDEDFTNFAKNRLLERSLVEGDIILVMMLGHAIPFTVTKTNPEGIVKITPESQIIIFNEPYSNTQSDLQSYR